MFVHSFLLISVLALIVFSTHGLSVQDVMVNNGSRGDNYFDPRNMNDFGVLKDVSHNAKKMKKFTKLAKMVGSDVADDEAADLTKNYFWGKSNGIIMEIGAIDGTYASQSKPMEEQLGWHRILVEGSPMHAKALTENTPNAFSFSCAICDTVGEVHFVNEGGAVGGIIEFMSPSFIERFHKDVHSLDPSKWHTLPNVQKIACFPLQKILASTHVVHVNAFIVDVEGGELAMLNSIKWTDVLFDVLIVETDPLYRPLGYERQVTTFLAHRGYQLMGTKGRNSWYKHFTFVPSAMPK